MGDDDSWKEDSSSRVEEISSTGSEVSKSSTSHPLLAASIRRKMDSVIEVGERLVSELKELEIVMDMVAESIGMVNARFRDDTVVVEVQKPYRFPGARGSFLYLRGVGTARFGTRVSVSYRLERVHVWSRRAGCNTSSQTPNTEEDKPTTSLKVCQKATYLSRVVKELPN